MADGTAHYAEKVGDTQQAPIFISSKYLSKLQPLSFPSIHQSSNLHQFQISIKAPNFILSKYPSKLQTLSFPNIYQSSKLYPFQISIKALPLSFLNILQSSKLYQFQISINAPTFISSKYASKPQPLSFPSIHQSFCFFSFFDNSHIERIVFMIHLRWTFEIKNNI